MDMSQQMQSTGHSSVFPAARPEEPARVENSASYEAYKKLLTGPSTGQMNLKAVKERAVALRRSLDELIDILQFQPQRLTWDDCLERFGVMGVRHQQILEQLRPLLKFYAAHPKAVNQSNAELIPLLLSTMKLPEAEARERELLQNWEQPSTASLANAFESLEASLTAVNSTVEELTHHSSSLQSSGILDPKGPRRRVMAQELRNEVNRVETGGLKRKTAEVFATGIQDLDLRLQLSEILQVPRPADDEQAEALLEAAMTGKGLEIQS